MIVQSSDLIRELSTELMSGMFRIDESAMCSEVDSAKNRLLERATRLLPATLDAMGAVGNDMGGDDRRENQIEERCHQSGNMS